MRILVLGASGDTGHELVEQAMARGHEVTAFVRDPKRLNLSGKRPQIVQGDARDQDDVRRAVEGQDAVLSALGPTDDASGDLMSASTLNVITAMDAEGIDRLIWMMGAGVSVPGDPPSLIGGAMRLAVRLLNSSFYRDIHQAMRTTLDSDLDWTIVRVPRLKSGPKEGGYEVSFKPPGPRAVSRADVAEFMLDQLESDEYVKRAPIIGY